MCAYGVVHEVNYHRRAQTDQTTATFQAHRRMTLSFVTASAHSFDLGCGGACSTICTRRVLLKACRCADVARHAGSDFGASTRSDPISRRLQNERASKNKTRSGHCRRPARTAETSQCSAGNLIFGGKISALGNRNRAERGAPLSSGLARRSCRRLRATQRVRGLYWLRGDRN